MPLSRIAETTSGRPVVLSHAAGTSIPVTGLYFHAPPFAGSKSFGSWPGARNR
jgi:hypothetical protein